MTEKYMRLANSYNGLTLMVGYITIDGHGQKIISDDSGFVDAGDAMPYDAKKAELINKLIKSCKEQMAAVERDTRNTIESMLK